LRRDDFAGGFNDQGSRIGVQRAHDGIVPGAGDAETVTHFDFQFFFCPENSG
jgi:hypothetical protein